MENAADKKLLTKPQVERLKALGSGLKVGRVLGDRVLVKTVKPWTDLDRVEQEGILVVPKDLKESYTPKESTGIVVATGFAPMGLDVGTMVMFSMHAGSEFSVGGEEGFRILDAKDILCTLEQADVDPAIVVPVKED